MVEDPTVAVPVANAVYTDTWSSMGDPEDQREARGVAFRRYQVDRALMSLAASDAVFVHCLPEVATARRTFGAQSPRGGRVMLLVIALGGNALLRLREPLSVDAQRPNVAPAARAAVGSGPSGH